MAKKPCVLSAAEIALINASLAKGDRVEVVPGAEHPAVYRIHREKQGEKSENK